MEKRVQLFENKEQCCGCEGCANVCPHGAITMEEDREGFLHSRINADICVGCGMCLNVCPIRRRAEALEQERRKPHIGIINLQYTNNYGAVIAASVLEKAVRSMIDSEHIIVQTIDYRPKHAAKNIFGAYRYQIKDANGIAAYIRLNRPKTDAEYRDQIIRSQKFDCFCAKFLNRTPVYRQTSLINADIHYVAYIAGSDVIWHPKRVDECTAEGFCLKFANKGERRISYAASIDSNDSRRLKKLESYYRDNLKNFDVISVREQGSMGFIQSLTDKEVEQCCDPALLFDAEEYEDMLQAPSDVSVGERYIYVYVLDECEQVVQYAKELAKRTGFKVFFYSTNPDYSDFGENSFRCTTDGPGEFLYRVKNAEYVLTNSFHSVVFSLLFEKKFLVFPRGGIKSRDLLEQMGLRDRMYTPETKTEDIDAPIDYIQVREKICQTRERSQQFLRRALKPFL